MISLCSRLTAQSHLVLVYTFSFYLICQEWRGSGQEKKIMSLIEQKRWLPLKAIAYKKYNSSLDFQCMNHQMLDCLQSKPKVSMKVDMVIYLQGCKKKKYLQTGPGWHSGATILLKILSWTISHHSHSREGLFINNINIFFDF